jgi:hypothetical protein
MPIMMYALPVLPGQEARAQDFEAEIRSQWSEMLALNEAAGVTRWAVANQQGPQGMLQLHLLEADDLSRLARDFTDSGYDRWWLGYLHDVCGIDRTTLTSMTPPPTVFDWQAGQL